MAKQSALSQETGKRKTAIARVLMTPGDGQITVNTKTFEEYFGRKALQMIIRQPFELTGTRNKFNISVNVMGGGLAGQADAVKHGIAKALLTLNPDYKKPLRDAGFLTRDSRIKERKKYGHKKARKSFQFSKR